MTPADHHDDPAVFRTGLACGIGAYAWWGLAAVYFKLVAHVPATVVLGHRIVWSVLLLAGLVTLLRRWGNVRALVRTRHVWPWLLASTVLIAVNWLVFIYAVATARLAEASLGYFMTPIINVLLGLLFLKETLRPARWGAVALAAAGVAYLTAGLGQLPWIALVLAFSFGFYGLLRKQAPAGPLVGLFLETALLAPLAALFLAFAHAAPDAARFNTPATLAILALAGIVTAVPLLWFAAAARRLRMVTLGFLQFLAPTLQFFLAVLAFAEPFDSVRAVAFAFIWAAVALFILDSAAALRRSRARRHIPAPSPPMLAVPPKESS